MIRIEDAVEVAVAAEEAFAFVTRIADYPAWLPGVLRAEPTGTPATEAGAPTAGAGTPAPEAGTPAPVAGFRLVSAGPGGMEIVSTGRVEAVDPPRSIAISATSGFFGLTASCEVTPLGPARSRIAVRAGIEPRGLATLAAGRIEQELRASVPDTLRRLREAVEGPRA
jgi:carbon monoxide dehydrogenase subunit G